MKKITEGCKEKLVELVTNSSPWQGRKGKEVHITSSEEEKLGEEEDSVVFGSVFEKE